MVAPDVPWTALKPMATFETSLEANYDRQVGRQAGRQTEKVTYRGMSYRFAPPKKVTLYQMLFLK